MSWGKASRLKYNQAADSETFDVEFFIRFFGKYFSLDGIDNVPIAHVKNNIPFIFVTFPDTPFLLYNMSRFDNDRGVGSPD